MKRHWFILAAIVMAVLIVLPAACNTITPDVALTDETVVGLAATLSPIEQLGKDLFFAKISSPSSMSCADCHAPNAGWTGPNAGNNLHGAVYRGAVPQRFGNRKPPSSAYAGFAPDLHYVTLVDEETDKHIIEFFGGTFWDGRATGERLSLVVKEEISNGHDFLEVYEFLGPIAEQALGPFLNPVEQNMPDAQAVCQAVARSKKLTQLFEQVWGTNSLDCNVGIDTTYDRIGLSIGAYESSAEVNPFSSKFDTYWHACLEAGNDAEDCGRAEGDKEDLDPLNIFTEQEFNGLIEFGEYCSDCHVSHIAGPGGTPPLFTDYSYHNIGVPKNPKNPFYNMDRVFLPDGSAINPDGAAFIDLGLGGFLRTRPEWAGLADDNECKFKTPTVRNVDARTGRGFPKAYMHNGALKSLHEVVDFYNTRDVGNWPPAECNRNLNDELFEGLPIGNFELEDDDVDAIVAFLRTLTDGYGR